LAEISVDLDRSTEKRKRIIRVCKSKCTHPKRRKNVRKVGWVGSFEVAEC